MNEVNEHTSIHHATPNITMITTCIINLCYNVTYN